MSAHRPDLLYSVQIARGVAALAVVATHAAMATLDRFADMPFAAYMLFRLGYLGVDFFFVLSGFIIAHATADLPRDGAGARYYFWSRVTRIYVPYLPVSLAMLAAFSLMPGLSMGVGAHYSLAASLFLLPSDPMPALTVARTLQHEVMFYFLFGLCLFLARRPWLIFLWAVPISLLMAHTLSPAEAIFAGSINLEFLGGMAAYAAYRRPAFFLVRYALLMAGLLLVLAAGWQLAAGGATALYRLVAGLGFVAMLLGLVHVETRVDFRRFRGLIFLGAASYAIYLVHNPCMSVLLRMLPPLPHWSLAFALFSVFSVLAGIGYFWLVERPLMHWVRRKLLRQRLG